MVAGRKNHLHFKSQYLHYISYNGGCVSLKLTLLLRLYIFSHLNMQNQGTLSDSIADDTGSACSGLIIAGMLPTVLAVQIVKYLPHQSRPLFALTNSLRVNSSLNTTS